MAENMPCRTNGPPSTESLIGAKCRGLTPHSVHQPGLGPSPTSLAVAATSRGRFPYVCVARKSTAAPDLITWAAKSAIQPAAAVAGPPTLRRASTGLMAAVARLLE